MDVKYLGSLIFNDDHQLPNALVEINGSEILNLASMNNYLRVSIHYKPDNMEIVNFGANE